MIATPPSPTLSRPHGEMAARYDVVVVGSGYGGAIAASQARPAGSIGVPARAWAGDPRGRLPRRRPLGAVGQLQVHRGARRLGRATGLFDLRAGDDLSVVVGCGLGGTSLINAGVALRPPDVGVRRRPLADELRGADVGPAELDPYFAEAERMLGSHPFPDALGRARPSCAVLRRGGRGRRRTR